MATIYRPDWDKLRKRLPDTYEVCVCADLLDSHTYDASKKIKPGSKESFEFTKAKAQQVIEQFKKKGTIPVQVYHGSDDENEKGIPNANENKSVVGTVLGFYIHPDDDRKLMCTAKMDNSKNASLLWNYAIHFTGASSGASLSHMGTFDTANPTEVSLLDKGARPNTGIEDVVLNDGRRIKLQLYTLQQDEEEEEPTIVSDPQPDPQLETEFEPEPVTEQHPELQSEPVTVEEASEPEAISMPQSREPVAVSASAATMRPPQPRDPVTKKFIAAPKVGGGAQGRAAASAAAATQPKQQQLLPRSDRATAMRSEFEQRVAQQKQQQQASARTGAGSQKDVNNRSYPLNQDFTGMPHTSMIGGPMQDIAVAEHNTYQQRSQQQQQQQQQAVDEKGNAMQQ
jgi:hypothetical protein